MTKPVLNRDEPPPPPPSSILVQFCVAMMEMAVWWSLTIFLGSVIGIAMVQNGKTLFWDAHHGWRHRLAGGTLLLWLFVGCFFVRFLVLSNQEEDVEDDDDPLLQSKLNQQQQQQFWNNQSSSSTTRTTTTIVSSPLWLKQHPQLLCLGYDVMLGFLGILATLTAARDFPHKHVQKYCVVRQSGTLAEKAIVTQDEMMEHAFYQGLNLWQALYLHLLATTTSTTTTATLKTMDRLGLGLGWYRLVALWMVTAPWYWRKRFPVHSFSRNWKRQQQQPQLEHQAHKINGKDRGKRDSNININNNNNRIDQNQNLQKQLMTETVMYKIKKWQYIFYKHVILHGLNISLALQQAPKQEQAEPIADNLSNLVYNPQWRLFWIALNAAYVLEFFLQSMVKRKLLSQHIMLALNQWLMLISTLAALQSVLRVVVWPVCLASVVLNFVHRHNDVINTLLVYIVFQTLFTLQQQQQQ